MTALLLVVELAAGVERAGRAGGRSQLVAARHRIAERSTAVRQIRYRSRIGELDGPAGVDSMTGMAASRAFLLLGLAIGSVACASSQASATRRPLPPPAGDGRAGDRGDRGAGPALASAARAPAPELKPDVQRAVDTAQSLVGSRDVVVDGRNYGAGCTALVRAAFDHAGKPLPADARTAGALLDVAKGRGAMRSGIRCSPGDVVFLADRPGGIGGARRPRDRRGAGWDRGRGPPARPRRRPDAREPRLPGDGSPTRRPASGSTTRFRSARARRPRAAWSSASPPCSEWRTSPRRAPGLRGSPRAPTRSSAFPSVRAPGDAGRPRRADGAGGGASRRLGGAGSGGFTAAMFAVFSAAPGAENPKRAVRSSPAGMPLAGRVLGRRRGPSGRRRRRPEHVPATGALHERPVGREPLLVELVDGGAAFAADPHGSLPPAQTSPSARPAATVTWSGSRGAPAPSAPGRFPGPGAGRPACGTGRAPPGRGPPPPASPGPMPGTAERSSAVAWSMSTGRPSRTSSRPFRGRSSPGSPRQPIQWAGRSRARPARMRPARLAGCGAGRRARARRGGARRGRGDGPRGIPEARRGPPPSRSGNRHGKRAIHPSAGGGHGACRRRRGKPGARPDRAGGPGRRPGRALAHSPGSGSGRRERSWRRGSTTGRPTTASTPASGRWPRSASLAGIWSGSSATSSSPTRRASAPPCRPRRPAPSCSCAPTCSPRGAAASGRRRSTSSSPCLERDCIPVVPERGSVGASGDLAPARPPGARRHRRGRGLGGRPPPSGARGARAGRASSGGAAGQGGAGARERHPGHGGGRLAGPGPGRPARRHGRRRRRHDARGAARLPPPVPRLHPGGPRPARPGGRRRPPPGAARRLPPERLPPGTRLPPGPGPLLAPLHAPGARRRPRRPGLLPRRARGARPTPPPTTRSSSPRLGTSSPAGTSTGSRSPWPST